MPPGFVYPAITALFDFAVLAGHPADPVAYNDRVPAVVRRCHIRQSSAALCSSDPGVLRIVAVVKFLTAWNKVLSTFRPF